MNALEVTNLTKAYGSFTALDSLSLAVPEGQMLALLGHNGAGKTTLMKLLMGLTRPTAGSVDVLGAPPGPMHRREIGFLPENVAFTGAMKGRDVLRFYARLKGAGRSQCEDLLERVGLSEAAHKPVNTYSKGMRQRLGLAQALLGAPRLLLLDEPTSGLDPVLRKAFYGILRDLKTQGTTIVVSSHVLTELEMRTDRIAILRRGTLVACDDLDGLRRRAGLPVRIRATVAEGRAQEVAARAGADGRVLSVNGRAIELAVDPEDKMDMVRRLAAGPEGLEDIDIVPPSLEDIYTHFGGNEDKKEARS